MIVEELKIIKRCIIKIKHIWKKIIKMIFKKDKFLRLRSKVSTFSEFLKNRGKSFHRN